MRKFPYILRLVLAGLVVTIAYFLFEDGVGSTFLGVVGGLAVIYVVIGLLRSPARLFSYPRPGYADTASLVLMVGAACAVILVGLLISSGPVTCGGQQLRPGDRCVDYESGAPASYSDVEGAPIRQVWIYLVIAAALVITASVLLIRRRPLTSEEVAAFEAQVARVHTRLLSPAHTRLYQTPDEQERFQEMLVQFEQEVEQERRRAGISILA